MIKKNFNLPMPINISYWWNFGFLLSMFLIIQILSGILISIHYCPNTLLAFSSLIHIIQNVKLGWLLHNIHLNGASIFFILMYIHISRGIYYNSFKLFHTWMIGSSIFIMSTLIAFLGYILPWGQMSFWGATVITNLISTIPYMGMSIIQWIWGGFSINSATLNRFFSFHFILPFLLILLILLHLYYLHLKGSMNPLGTNSNLYKIPFNFYFILKDLISLCLLLTIFIILILQYPYLLSDPDNFFPANPMSTPPHIQPEWYFLFAYTILRSIPNKLGGILALISAILILYTLPFFKNMKMNSSQFYFLTQFSFWSFINSFLILTWLGSQSIEPPYINLSQLFSLLYFFFFFLNMMSSNLWDKLMF